MRKDTLPGNMYKASLLVCSLLHVHLMPQVYSVNGSQSDKTKSSSPCNTTTEPCLVNFNSASARVSHPRTVFTTYSCVTRNARDKQVHVISTYAGTVVGRITLNVTRLPSSGTLPVVLVLTSYEAVQWNITVQEGIHIDEINLLSSFAEQSVVQVDQTPAPNIKKERRYFGFNRRSHQRGKLLAYTRGRYGLVTSFSGVFSVNSTDTWNLATGISGICDNNYDFISAICNKRFDGYYPHSKNCSKFINCQAGTVHPLECDQNTRWSQQRLACLAAEDVNCTITPVVPPGGTIGPEEQCLKSQRCWVQYNFRYDTRWSNCSGKQYISRTQYPEAPFLGVVLCDNNRYKLFLSTAPWEEFLNIADSLGHGADHCELVGGSEGSAVLPIDYWDSPFTTGYYRAYWGQNFQKGPIGHEPGNVSKKTSRLYTSWYECGVTIPGDYKVLPVTDFPRSTTTTTTSTTTTTTSTTTTTTSTTTTTTSTTTTPMAGGLGPPLRFSKIPLNVTEVVGKKNVLLQCGTNLPADITWFKEEKELSSGSGIVVIFKEEKELSSGSGISQGVVNITELTLSHQGRYTCRAALGAVKFSYIETHAWVHVYQY